MATSFSVQSRVFTADSAVNAQGVFGGTTTYNVIATKDLNIPLGLTSGVVLNSFTASSPTGTYTKGQVYNPNYYQPSVIGNRSKMYVVATADETNTETIALFQVLGASGSGPFVGLETKIATLAPGDSVSYPFRADSTIDSRSKFPTLVACNGTSGTPATTPSLHISVVYTT